MASYYSSNAMYNYLKTNPNEYLTFTVGNMWQLVYGDNNCVPTVLVLAVGVLKVDYDKPLGNEENDALAQLQALGKKCSIPVLYVRFIAEDNIEIENVRTIHNGQFLDRSLADLTAKFKALGLPTSNTPTGKYLNDKTSSAYHSWQRKSLGRELTVSDIDLWRLDVNKVPIEIYELKRSKIPLAKWTPYPDDYRNFKLLSNLANKSGLGFRIVYNLREENPFNDDISNLKIFDVDFSKSPPVNFNSTKNLSDFLK